MPDTNVKPKRPPISAFGEGTVSKRTRTGAHEKPKHTDGKLTKAKSIASAIRSSEDAFRVKPVSSAMGGPKPQRLSGLPLNPKEAMSTFKRTTGTVTPAEDLGRPKATLQGPRRLPLPESDTDFAQPRKKARIVPPVVHIENQNGITTPLVNRIRPPDLRSMSSDVATPGRKVVPFHALQVPSLDEASGETPSSLKPLPAPNFDLGGRSKGKLSAMKALEPPILDLPEEEPSDEHVELQRGLLVSPEKGEKRRNRFVRNGLAERAQTLINRSSTALTLWKKDIEPFASHSERLQADLRLRVKSIIHVSRNANLHSRNAGAIRSVLAICAALDGLECTTLFSSCHNDHDSRSLKEGSEVLVWKPWQETAHPRTLFCSRFLALPSSGFP
ncbi:uncharacterized protein FOMMEDRAFT_166578 [Fomitiporia mediterranea MF3/22]|uniref:uncharacterized protein n=1 Tax=Fomitiporia mediterranea (strain MF3/22) TaxID=694068 RepID=UPI0004407432|nr:uncharacterized protein FOMMEDRAFT_166578 [Fomitiporia mediterranea MF3/22]EJD04789.1 hypothetical protein FOMMEDRAFT_166578 [Fomitiporia mediterranea MF3/22]